MDYTRKLQALSPNTRYIVRVRSISGLGVASLWSEGLNFTTSADQSTPKPPTLLVFNFGSRYLNLSWTPPTNNTDETILQDLSGYEVRLIANGITKIYRTVHSFFAYTFEQNRIDFGTGQANITVEIRAYDVSGNKSTALISAVANSPPNIVLAAPLLIGAFTMVSITVPSTGIDDYNGFELHHSTTVDGTYTIIYSGAGDSYIHNVAQGSTHYYKYKIIDFFNQKSIFSPTAFVTTTVTVDTTDETAPANPAGLTVGPGIDPVTQIPYMDLSWVAVADFDMDHFDIRYKRTIETVFRTTTLGKDIFAHRIGNLQSGGIYQFQIRAVDFSGNGSAWVSTSPATVTMGIGTIYYDPESVAGNIIVSGTGLIKSFDYNPDGSAGWKLSSGGGLEINAGIIKAPSLQIGVSTENFVVNSSFENGTTVATGWNQFTDAGMASTVTNAFPKYQAKSQVGTITSNGTFAGYNQNITLPESYPINSWFTVSVWMRPSVAGKTGRVRFRDNVSATEYTSVSFPLVLGGWTRVVHSFRLTAATNDVQISFWVESPVNGEVHRFDGAMLTNSSYTTAYAPATLEIPDNYITSAYISSLNADKIRTGTLQGPNPGDPLQIYMGSGQIVGTNWSINTAGAVFQNSTISVVGAGGAVTLDSASFRAVYSGNTQFLVNSTGVFIGGQDSSNADVYFDTANDKTIIQNNTLFKSASGSIRFEINATPDAYNNVLRLYDSSMDESNANKNKFTLKSDGNISSLGAIVNGGIVTGALIRTAISGARVELKSGLDPTNSFNSISLYTNRASPGDYLSSGMYSLQTWDATYGYRHQMTFACGIPTAAQNVSVPVMFQVSRGTGGGGGSGNSSGWVYADEVYLDAVGAAYIGTVGTIAQLVGDSNTYVNVAGGSNLIELYAYSPNYRLNISTSGFDSSMPNGIPHGFYNGGYESCKITGYGGSTTFTIGGLPGSSSDALVRINAYGELRYDTSSEKYKQAIGPLEDTYDVSSIIDGMLPIAYEEKETSGETKPYRYIGISAEQTFTHAPQLVVLDKEGAPKGILYDKISIVAIAGVKDLRRRVAELESMLAKLQIK